MKSNLLASVALVAFGLSHAVMAADAPIRTPVKAQPAPLQYDWSGPYVGFHFGYGGGSFGPGTNPLPSQGVLFPHSITGLVGGYQAGYNFQYPNGLVIGLEADVTARRKSSRRSMPTMSTSGRRRRSIISLSPTRLTTHIVGLY